MRLLLSLLVLLLAVPVSAQTRTFAWTHSQANTDRYELCVDARPCMEKGKPTLVNGEVLVSEPLPDGTYALVLKACNAGGCVPSVTSTVTFGVPAVLSINPVSPETGSTFTSATATSTGIPIRVTVTGATKVELHWDYGGVTVLDCAATAAPNACVVAGDVYTFTMRPSSGAGTRTWFAKAYNAQGLSVASDKRAVVVTR